MQKLNSSNYLPPYLVSLQWFLIIPFQRWTFWGSASARSKNWCIDPAAWNIANICAYFFVHTITVGWPNLAVKSTQNPDRVITPCSHEVVVNHACRFFPQRHARDPTNLSMTPNGFATYLTFHLFTGVICDKLQARLITLLIAMRVKHPTMYGLNVMADRLFG